MRLIRETHQEAPRAYDALLGSQDSPPTSQADSGLPLLSRSPIDLRSRLTLALAYFHGRFVVVATMSHVPTAFALALPAGLLGFLIPIRMFYCTVPSRPTTSPSR